MEPTTFRWRSALLCLTGALLISCHEPPKTTAASADPVDQPQSSVSQPQTSFGAEVEALGWGRDGSVLTYQAFSGTDSGGQFHSKLNVGVVNLITDELLWSFGRSWEEDLSGDGTNANTPPRDLASAWDLVLPEVQSDLESFGLQELEDGGPLRPLPVSLDGESVAVEVVSDSPDDLSYSIQAVSRGVSKVLATGTKSQPSEVVMVLGAFLNPRGDRLAVVMAAGEEGGPWLPTLWVVGCRIDFDQAAQ